MLDEWLCPQPRMTLLSWTSKNITSVSFWSHLNLWSEHLDQSFALVQSFLKIWKDLLIQLASYSWVHDQCWFHYQLCIFWRILSIWQKSSNIVVYFSLYHVYGIAPKPSILLNSNWCKCHLFCWSGRKFKLKFVLSTAEILLLCRPNVGPAMGAGQGKNCSIGYDEEHQGL